MSIKSLYSVLLILIALSILSACSDDNSTSTDSNEFVAQASNFNGWNGWQIQAVRTGSDPAKLAGAHNSDVESNIRTVYVKDKVMGSNNMYNKGTILVKQVKDKDGNQLSLVAMVKRGGSFNSTHNGWEWFMLNTDGTIIARADTMLGGACNSCHAKAGNDYVFSDSFSATDKDFSGWNMWHLAATNTGPASLLGPVHNGNDEGTKRLVYAKYPTVMKQGDNYPNGYILVKHVIDKEGATLATVGMAKNGGNFNSSNRSWEWFLLNEDGTIAERGGNLKDNLCNGCHTQASMTDYVFTTIK